MSLQEITKKYNKWQEGLLLDKEMLNYLVSKVETDIEKQFVDFILNKKESKLDTNKDMIVAIYAIFSRLK